MFTGIIESTGVVQSVENEGTNKIFWIKSPISEEFKPDQSVAHSGVCLTVEEVKKGMHRVTAIAETLSKTNLSGWSAGSMINLERSMQVNGRFDGHIVQGHSDSTATCIDCKDQMGSREYQFEFDRKFSALVIEKGSVTVNGISLTIFHVEESKFSVAIIPYTYQHTNINQVQKGDLVNIEFDVIGKYVNRINSLK